MQNNEREREHSDQNSTYVMNGRGVNYKSQLRLMEHDLKWYMIAVYCVMDGIYNKLLPSPHFLYPRCNINLYTLPLLNKRMLQHLFRTRSISWILYQAGLIVWANKLKHREKHIITLTRWQRSHCILQIGRYWQLVLAVEQCNPIVQRWTNEVDRQEVEQGSFEQLQW